MSQVPAAPSSTTVSISGPEQNANVREPANIPLPTPVPAPAPKARSCVVCRSRKVRCDRQSPCSNCRRANIACVAPPADRPPKWARRLERITKTAATSQSSASPGAGPGVDKVMDRLRNLESLVKELTGQLELARAAAGSAGSGSSGFNSPTTSPQGRDVVHQMDTSSSPNVSSVQTHFGRFVLQDAGRSRYVSSGFWSRVNDELDGLKMDLEVNESDSSEEESPPGRSPSTLELERSPSDRHAFLFRHNLSASAHDLRELHPLPSQIPFLLDVFSENVNFISRLVHIPTVTKMVRELRSDMTRLTPANEALMFSIYYAAITSMEEDDIVTNFGSSKIDLNLKYRVGLEHALAKADFLNAPDLVLVQALANFLCLVRRHDSPRFVWMMTGLVIRMAQYLGLQRDGAHFEHLTPYEVEMRRRIWWALCMLDLRASEDQGTDLTMASGSFDTKIPLNINDSDISPDSRQMPQERDGLTDMSMPRITAGSCEIMRQIMLPGAASGATNLEDQGRLLKEIYQKYEHGYLRYATEPGNIAYWVTITIARLVMAKMTLIIYLPVLFSSPSEQLSDEIRMKLLVSGIEVAEYNHALNAEQACRHWRWIYQTYTHWHAIVYLMIEISRRPWSCIVERAWVALHSSWLIPAQALMDKNLRMWVPLRKLMAKARKHRDYELNRLRQEPHTAALLDIEDRNNTLPPRSNPLPPGSTVEILREQWRKLVGISEGQENTASPAVSSHQGLNDPSMHASFPSQPATSSTPAYSPDGPNSHMILDSTYLGMAGQQADQMLLQTSHFRDLEPTSQTHTPSVSVMGQTSGPSYNPYPMDATDWQDGRTMGPGFIPWLWADTDPSVDVYSNIDVDFVDVNADSDGEMNWYNWVESAKGMAWDANVDGTGRT